LYCLNEEQITTTSCHRNVTRHEDNDDGIARAQTHFSTAYDEAKD